MDSDLLRLLKERNKMAILDSNGLTYFWSKLKNLLNGKANSSHTHAIADVNNLQTTLNGKANSSHTHNIADVNDLQNTLNHYNNELAENIADIEELYVELEHKSDKGHTHEIGEVNTLAEITKNILPIYWRRIKIDINEYNISDFAYGSDMFVAVGDSGRVCYSNNGIDWTSIKLDIIGNSSLNSVCYGNDKFVAVGDIAKAAYSTDGITWNRTEEIAVNNEELLEVVYGNDKFVAISYNKSVYSTDGIT